jgi:hypothetical protein
MANGLLCKHCGWQETNHIYGYDGIFDPASITGGYTHSLKTCPGFSLSKEDRKLNDESNLLTDFECKVLERRARERAAWGLYSSIIRQEKFERDIEKLDSAIQGARTEEERKSAEEKKETFLKECRLSQGFVIG